MRALVIAVVLSLVVSGEAFAGDTLWFDLKDTQTTETECKKALSEGNILNMEVREFSEPNIRYHTTLISYEGDIYKIEYQPKYELMSCDKGELILKTD